MHVSALDEQDVPDWQIVSSDEEYLTIDQMLLKYNKSFTASPIPTPRVEKMTADMPTPRSEKTTTSIPTQVSTAIEFREMFMDERSDESDIIPEYTAPKRQRTAPKFRIEQFDDDDDVVQVLHEATSASNKSKVNAQQKLEKQMLRVSSISFLNP